VTSRPATESLYVDRKESKAAQKQTPKSCSVYGGNPRHSPVISWKYDAQCLVQNPLSRFLYLVFALGLPGTLFEALLRLEPHGGGTPVEMLFIIMPFNIAFYSVIVYGFGALGKIFHRER
jgi:hypothetical protein